MNSTEALRGNRNVGDDALRRMRRLVAWSWTATLFAVLIFLVLYPLAMLMAGAFTDINPVIDTFRFTDLTLDNFLHVLASESVHAVLFNTIVSCLGGTVVAVVIGVSFSWIVVRTNTPFKGFIAGVSVLPLFIPPLVAAVAWSILGSPRSGLINIAFRSLGIDFTINFYSLGGIIFVFGIYYAPYVFMFTASALRNMDPTLEEAAEITGASPLRTMLTVTFPLVLPAIVSSMLLSFVIMLGVYGIPAVLGPPANIQLLTTYIYRLVVFTPPLYNYAAAVAILLAIITAVLLLVQQQLIAGRSYVTISGKGFRPRILDLGRWRWLALALSVAYLLIVVVLPMGALVIAAFRRFLFFRDLASVIDGSMYSMMHFNAVFENPQTLRSVWNTIEVGLLAAVIGGTVAFAIAYTVNRTEAPARRLIEVISVIPVAIPSLIIGVAYMWAWIGLPNFLYGTITILALAFVGRFLPDTMKALSTSLMQIHKELEEAAWISGRTRLGAIATIVLPLALPGLAAALTLMFVLSIRELGASLFLYTTNTRVMSIMLLEFYESGTLGVTAAFGLVQVALLTVLVMFSNWLSRRAGAAV